MKRSNCEDAAMTVLAVMLCLAGVALGIAALGGWVYNIVKLVGMNLDTFSGLMLLRIIGIVIAPLGVVLGYV